MARPKSDVQTEGNTIKVAGWFDKDALRRCGAALHQIQKRRFKKIVVDFTDLAGAFPAELLPFAVQCRAALSRGTKIILDGPSATKLARHFENCNWSHLIDPLQFGASERESADHIAAVTFLTPDQQYQIIDEVVERLLQCLPNFSRDSFASIEWAANELADNVLTHADSAIGGTLQLTVDKKSGIVEFIVCDAGRSIPMTLREGHPGILSDAEALDKAIREGVTKSTVTNMGNGLFGAYRLAQLSGGHFRIYSGYASLDYYEPRGLHVTKQSAPYSGTVVVCGIATHDPNLLAQALTFKGIPKVPAFSYIDKITDSGIVSIRMLDEVRSFGSRELARAVRTKVENLLAVDNSRIVLDLDGVALISSSFADEVFGKLIANLGPMTFMSKIEIKNSTLLVSQLIDRAIAQRLALGN